MSLNGNNFLPSAIVSQFPELVYKKEVQV